MAKFLEVAEQSRDVWPKRVKLDFRTGDGPEETHVWLPGQQRLHEVFLRLGQPFYDFSLKYLDEDRDEVVVDPSRCGVEAMVEGMAGEPVRIIVVWRPPRPSEWALVFAHKRAQEVSTRTEEAVKEAKVWISGGGEASSESVSAARERVEKLGIRPRNVNGNFVRCQCFDLERWGSVCDNLQKELELSTGEVSALKNGEFCDGCEAFVFHDLWDGQANSTRVVAYRTVRDVPSKKIHIVYGRHESVQGQVLGFPAENCIKLGVRIFTVLPNVSPHVGGVGVEVVDNPFAIPAGWAPVAANDERIASILRDVVAPYSWGTNLLVLKGGDGAWEGYRTARYEAKRRGGRLGGVSAFKSLSGGQYVFTEWGARLLIEAVPTKSAELINTWKLYAQLSAQADWGRRLSMPQGDEVNES